MTNLAKPVKTARDDLYKKLLKEKEAIEKKLIKLDSGNDADGVDLADQECKLELERFLIARELKGERWCYTSGENENRLVFDTETGYLWPNLLAVEKLLKHGNYASLSVFRKCAELYWGQVKNWELPTAKELIAILKYKEIPNRDIIKDDITIELGTIDKFTFKHVVEKSTSSGIFLPCNKSYHKEYMSLLDAKDKSENASRYALIDLFINNGLSPEFASKNTVPLFNTHRKRKLLVTDLNYCINTINFLRSNTNKQLTDASIDSLLTGYNTKSINKSTLEYHKYTTQWIETLISLSSEFEKKNNELLSSSNNMLLLLQNTKTIRELNDGESLYLQKNSNDLKTAFDLDMKSTISYLINVKDEIKQASKDIFSITDEANTYDSINEIITSCNYNFKAFAQYTFRLFTDQKEKFENYSLHHEYIEKVLALRNNLLADYDLFVGKKIPDFKAHCEDEMVDTETSDSWIKDWREARFLFVSKLLDLITTFDVLPTETILDLYATSTPHIENLNDFYEGDVVNIHQKPDSSELLEKYTIEIERLKLTNQYQRDLERIVFSLETNEQKLSLINWTKPWTSHSINEIINLIQTGDKLKLTTAFSHSLDRFVDLSHTTLERFIDDISAYETERKNQEKLFNSLVHKMSKELRTLDLATA